MARPVLLSLAAVVLALAQTAAISAEQAASTGREQLRNSLIAFVRDDGLYTIRPDGTGLHRLVRDSHVMNYVWSPDGRWIAFISPRRIPKSDPCWRDSRHGCPWALFVISVATGVVRQLTPDRLGIDLEMSWSPDSTRLAFSSVGINVVSRDGRRRRPLLRQPVTSRRYQYDRNPAWSSTGLIAFEHSDGNRTDNVFSSDIWAVADSGGPPRRLTFNPYGPHDNRSDDSEPDFSPNGTHLAYLSAGPSGVRSVFLVDANGTNRGRVTIDGKAHDRFTWAPDSRRIAVVSEGTSLTGGDIVLIDVRSRVRTTLIRTRVGELSLPSWSSDGSRIAYGYCRDGSNLCTVTVARADGRDRRPLTKGFAATWQPVRTR